MTEPPIALEDIRDQVAGLLGVPAESLAQDDDLISFGLDSLRMMSLAGRWRKRGFAVGFAELAANPTLRCWCDILRAAPRLETRAAPAAPEPEAQESAEPFPLAPMQHAQWVGRDGGQRLGGVAAHLYVEFDGAGSGGAGIDPDRLASAVDQLVRRHPMLRVQVLPDGTQQVLPKPKLQIFEAVDLREADEDEARLRLAEIREAKSSQTLAVHEGQVIDVLLVSLPGGRSRLCLDVDMIAADAMSYRVLVADLAALYQGESLEKPQKDFRRHLVEKLAACDPASEADRLWWAGRLEELPSPPQLPVVAEADYAPDARTVRHHHWLAPERKAALYARCHEHGVTPAMALASIFAAAVGNWSANPKFLLNLPLFTREETEAGLDRVVGDFTSSVMLGVDLSAPATVGERAHEVQRAFHEAAAHSAYSGLSVLRDLSRLHGEQVLANVVYTSAIGLGELFADSVTQTFGSPVHIISQGPQVALDAQVTEVSGGLLLNWDVREPYLRPGAAEAMFAWYTAEVDRLADNAEQWSRPSGAGAASKDQRAARDALFDPGPAPQGSGQTLHGGFFECAEENPDAVAVIAQDGTTTSYGKLREQALAVAGALVDSGVKRGDAVAVALPKGAAQVPALLGILAAGAAYVPVGVDQPPARRQQMAQTADVRAVIAAADEDLAAPGVPVVAFARAAEHCRPLPQPVPVTGDDLAYVLFTSGSTGVPKGVELRHGAAMNTLEDLVWRFEIAESDRCLSLAALESDMSVFDVFVPLGVGGAVVVIDESSRREPATWARLVERHAVTCVNWIPGWLDILLDTPSGDLGSLRVVLLGGDWVSVDLPRRLRERAPRSRFAGLGGATETAIHASVCEVDQPQDGWLSVPYGRPLRGMRCRVVNARGEDCPDWAVGEIWFGGPGIAEGYRGDAARTAERFVQHEGMRWYRTGDLGRHWPGGTVEFVGRADHRVKISGYRVELGEVESALRQAPRVLRAVALALGEPTARMGTRIAAAVAGAPGNRPDTDEVLAALARSMPQHMVPTQLLVLESMPLTDNGKLDRAAVRRLLEEAGPTRSQRAPRTKLEAALVRILHDVLGREIGAEEDFFRFGVDSIFAIKAVARIRDWLDSPSAAVADFFAARTVAGLARRLAEKDGEPGRLEQVAEVYLEVADLSEDELLAQTNEEESYA
nr:non-ribosomal peptide synthetase [Segniliparus rugosus]